MLFIHFFEGNGPARLEVARAFVESAKRSDDLFASCLTMGEFFAGARLHPDNNAAVLLAEKVKEMNFGLLPFDERAISIFADLRSIQKIKAPDAINLACAAAAGVDLFLTSDKRLRGVQVPGIKFIAAPAALI